VSNSAVTTLLWHLPLKTYISINGRDIEKCEAQYLSKMFPDSGWNFGGLKHQSEKMTAVGPLTVCMVVACTTAHIDKVIPYFY